MEKYDDMEGNALIAYNMYDANAVITAGQQRRELGQGMRITCQSGLEMERNQLGNPEVL